MTKYEAGRMNIVCLEPRWRPLIAGRRNVARMSLVAGVLMAGLLAAACQGPVLDTSVTLVASSTPPVVYTPSRESRAAAPGQTQMPWATLRPASSPTPLHEQAVSVEAPTSDVSERSDGASLPQNPPGGADPAAEQPLLPAGAIGLLLIPRIGASLPVFEVSWGLVNADGLTVGQWQWAAAGSGYHRGTAWLGEQGNCVLSVGPGASDAAGRDEELAVGDELELSDGATRVTYTIATITKVREVGASLQERREHAMSMAPTDDARLTLIACWPAWACTHRLVFVAERN